MIKKYWGADGREAVNERGRVDEWKRKMRIIQGNVTLLDEIWPLWERLNEVHTSKSMHFKERYEHFTVEERKKSMLRLCEKKEMRVFLLKDKEGKLGGYCVAFFESGCSRGNIESLLVDEALRGQGHGRLLMQEALAWLEEQRAEQISLDVVYGNDDVLEFYQQCGFYPKFVVLERK